MMGRIRQRIAEDPQTAVLSVIGLIAIGYIIFVDWPWK